MNATIPVYVLTGFLGSGKTTLLNRVLDDAKARGLKPAIVMNEVGDVNVEGQTIDAAVPMAELLGGCICCTSKGDLGLELVQLAQQEKPDVIWIESTGIAQPLDVVEGVTEASLYAKLELANVVTVVDARHLLDRIRIGSGKTFRLMKEQIRAADILVLNKADLVAPAELEELREALAAWNPQAVIHVVSRAELDPRALYAYAPSGGKSRAVFEASQEDELEPTDREASDGRFKFANASAGHAHVNAFTYFFGNDIDSVRFERFLKELPENVYRAKGIVGFRDTASLFLFQHAYGESDFLRVTPQKSVNRVAVFIGEGFSREKLEQRLKELEA
ncbi:CobW family GTP-binding protein [Cohnella suwonensis]|uniref:CobW family GTP-binding protein n=1 Tax=Cohnella suwonensis TaxID=696072 RepID=A0ABW0LQN0_9BACL